MLRNTLIKNISVLIISSSLMVFLGCMVTKKSGEFVESLRNPTTFPEIYYPEIKYIDEIVPKKSLAEGENVKIIPLGKDESSSIYLFQIRQNAEMGAHYHKSHDEILFINKGSGILELNGTRHSVKEGMVVIIPRKSMHKYVNTGEEINVTVSMISPPFDGADVKVIKEDASYKKKGKTIYDKAMKKSERELKKEDGESDTWFGLWGKDDEKDGTDEAEVIPEEQKILVLTEEGREKIREARRKVKEEEQAVIDGIILDEKLKILQRLRNEGLISEKEFEIKRTEVMEESELKD